MEHEINEGLDIEENNENENATNNVDVSEERIKRELTQALSDHDINENGQQEGVNTSEPSAPEYNENHAQSAASLLMLAGTYAHLLFAPGWKITSAAIEAMAMAWGRVVAKYVPDSVLAYLPDVSGDGGECIECDAVAITVLHLLPEIGKPRHINADNSEKSSEPDSEKSPLARRCSEKDQPGGVMQEVTR